VLGHLVAGVDSSVFLGTVQVVHKLGTEFLVGGTEINRRWHDGVLIHLGEGEDVEQKNESNLRDEYGPESVSGS